jgi:hypothetical protein
VSKQPEVLAVRVRGAFRRTWELFGELLSVGFKQDRRRGRWWNLVTAPQQPGKPVWPRAAYEGCASGCRAEGNLTELEASATEHWLQVKSYQREELLVV